jgi:Flp pilus assembly protein TadG
MKTVATKRENGTAERGQILVLTALSMTVLLGMAALSIDASFMFDTRNKLHAAADAAAKTGAFEVRRNPSVTSGALLNFANQQVTSHGLTAGACGSTTAGTTAVCINHPPATGPFAGNQGYVEAVLTRVTSTFFGNMFNIVSMTPGARAVAGTSAPLNCLITTAIPGTTPTSLSIGNATIVLNGCGVGDAGDLAGTNPNAAISGTPTPSVEIVGTCSGTCSGMGTLTQGGASPIDPLLGLITPPTVAGTCVAGTAATLSPGCYSSIATTVTTLTAGIYKLTGTVNIDNLSGSNVMLYLTGSGQLTAANNKQLTLTAPTSGSYSGIAIYQDPSDSNNFNTGNNFTLDVNGAIYMPGTNVDFPNSLSYNDHGCSLFIARSLSIRNGNGITFSNSACASTFSSAAFLSVSIAE